MTFITVRLEVSCLLRFTPAANLVAHISQFRDGSLILYWRRIRKFVTYIQRTDTKRTDTQRTDREFNYRDHSFDVPMERRVERANTVW